MKFASLARATSPGILLAALIVGCTDPATEVIVGLHTDLGATAMDSYRFSVASAGHSQRAGPFARAQAGRDLPTSFGIAPRDEDYARTVTVVVEGLRAGAVVLTTTRSFDGFSRGHTTHLCVALAARCLSHAAGSARCPADQACSDQGCVPILAPATPVEDPACAGLDAGQPADDAGAPADAADAGPSPMPDGGPRLGCERDGGAAPASPDPWWDADWSYRVPYDFTATSPLVADHPVQLEIDFRPLLKAVCAIGALDPNSPRVVEQPPPLGAPAMATASFFHADLANPGRGLLLFRLAGATAAGQTRHYEIYFDVGTHQPPPLARTSTTVSNGLFRLQQVGRNAGGVAVGIGSGRSVLLPDLAAPASPILSERRTKLLAGALDFGTGPDTGRGAIASAVYPPMGDSVLRLDVPGLHILESAVTLPTGAGESLTIREFIILTSGRWARFYTRFENEGSAALSGAKYFETFVPIIGDGRRETATLDATSKTFLLAGAMTNVIGANGPVAPSNYLAAADVLGKLAMDLDLASILPGMAVDNLEFAREWTLPLIPAHGTYGLPADIAAGDKSTVSATLGALRQGLSVATGTVSVRP